MALVTDIERIERRTNGVHRETRCSYSVFKDQHGNLYLQLVTYGSDDREMKDTVSQTIQLDADATAKLVQAEGLSAVERRALRKQLDELEQKYKRKK